jgi:sugar lactone lactonase YvrE
VRRHTAASEAGFSIVLAVFSILILLTLGIAMVSLVVEDSDLSVTHVQENQAFYAAHAGVEYAVVKLSGNWSWGGLASPGKNVGAGYFWIAPPDAVDENGAALPAGRKRIVSNGVVGNTLRQIQVQVAQGMISTYAGTGVSGYTGDGGAATLAKVGGPEGVAVASNGDLYIADTANHVIRKVVAATGIITTVAGTGAAGASGDGGAATAAKLRNPEDVCLASNGDLYIADTANHEIRKVTAATGVITRVAGTGASGSTGDGGAATSAKLNKPAGIEVASNGDLYISDTLNNRVRKVTAATGNIAAYAGTGTGGYTGDGGAATSARLSGPQGLVLSSGDLYVADTVNNVIRKVTVATGTITTFAGTGTAGSTGDGGAAASATLNAPQAIDVSSAGDFYIADTGSNKIRRVQSGSLIITTIAGTGTAGFSGDGGAATSANLNSPRGIAIASTGVYYIGDTTNNRIRKVTGLYAVVAWVETRT